MSGEDSIKDRNGNDVKIGDWVYFLRGSMALDGYYETGAFVVIMNTRNKVVKTDDGSVLFWNEIWKEREE